MNNDEDSFSTEVVESFPYDVVVEPHVPVTLRSGVVISVKLWLPQGAPGERFPAVLEAMPYRKDDNSLVDDSARFGFFSGHGYVGVRMDLRGSGTSTGSSRTSTRSRSSRHLRGYRLDRSATLVHR